VERHAMRNVIVHRESLLMFKNTLSAALALGLLCGAAAVPAGEAPAERKIAAVVNGDAIYESELAEGLPPKLFGSTLKGLKTMKLERAMTRVMVRHFLTQQQIKVADSVVDEQIAELRKNPPPAPCTCCVYTSLEDYLTGGLYTLAEYREILRNDTGMNQYVEQMWLKSCPDEAARVKLVAGQRAGLEAQYLKLWHIFFSGAASNAPPGTPPTAQRAEAAWQRLQKGEAFADLAKELSDDKASIPEGGSLGIVDRESSPFGAATMAATLAALKPGTYSKPVETLWGYHIFRREALTDADILKILKDRFMEDKGNETMKTLRETAKVQCAAGYESVRP